MSDSESEFEEQPQPAAQALPTVAQPAATQPTPAVAKKNARNAGRKPGKAAIPQKNTEYQQSKLMADTFKEYTEMMITLKKELEDQKKLLNETINSEETKHKKDIKNAVQEARMAFARTLNR